jgi:replication-associated recombination protein RarA
MLEAGEDRLYIARRLVRFASEDVGNADPGALTLTLAAKEAYDFLGDPEGELALAQATLYLALAPSRMRCTWRTTRRRKTWPSSPPSPCRSTSATRRRGS